MRPGLSGLRIGCIHRGVFLGSRGPSNRTDRFGTKKSDADHPDDPCSAVVGARASRPPPKSRNVFNPRFLDRSRSRNLAHSAGEKRRVGFADTPDCSQITPSQHVAACRIPERDDSLGLWGTGMCTPDHRAARLRWASEERGSARNAGSNDQAHPIRTLRPREEISRNIRESPRPNGLGTTRVTRAPRYRVCLWYDR